MMKKYVFLCQNLDFFSYLCRENHQTMHISMKKPKKETLDRLSLFVGFQDWEGLQKAIHGETSAEENYSMKNIGEKQKPDFQENKNGSFPED